jgi:hypothetical protein
MQYRNFLIFYLPSLRQDLSNRFKLAVTYISKLKNLLLRLKPLLMKLWLSARNLVASGVSYASSLALNLSLKLQDLWLSLRNLLMSRWTRLKSKLTSSRHLTEFFKLQEQLAAHIREEELKSITVYDPDQNHMEAALKRVMAAQEMDRLVIQIRECLVYSAPPEMGALYSSVTT